MKELSQPETRKWRGRLLAVLLGLSLCAVLFGGWLYWQVSYVDGVETCSQCGMQRDVDRRGPFWFRSEPYASRQSRELSIASCSHHVWVPSGCWQEDGGWALYAPVTVNR